MNAQQNVWPNEVKSVEYASTADNTKQPALFYAPKTKTPVPLLVALHPWGGDYQYAPDEPYGKWCVEHQWILIYPNFRGPNSNRDALGSDLAVADIVSAVEYAKANAQVDTKRIYLIGGSGGGHMALLMAGRHPEIWAGVSAWVPPTDLVAFYHESKDGAAASPYKLEFIKNLENACGGAPGASPQVDEQYRRRSPLMWLPNAKNLPLDISAGILDGYGSGSVLISHSLKAFNVVADEKDRLAEAQMKAFTPTAVPKGLEFSGIDPLYEDKPPLFRRQSGKARITIFKGGHTEIFAAGLTWLSRQTKE